MIKKFENFRSEIDPYGEERWEDPVPTGDIVILRDIAVNLHLNPTEIQLDEEDRASHFEFTIDYPHRGILEFSVSNGSIWWRENVMSLVNNYAPRFTLTDKVIKDLTEEAFVRVYTDIAEELKPNYS